MMQRDKQFCVWYLLYMCPAGALEYYSISLKKLNKYVLLVSLMLTPSKLAYISFVLRSTMPILFKLTEHQAKKVGEFMVVSSTVV